MRSHFASFKLLCFVLPRNNPHINLISRLLIIHGLETGGPHIVFNRDTMAASHLPNACHTNAKIELGRVAEYIKTTKKPVTLATAKAVSMYFLCQAKQ